VTGGVQSIFACIPYLDILLDLQRIVCKHTHCEVICCSWTACNLIKHLEHYAFSSLNCWKSARK